MAHLLLHPLSPEPLPGPAPGAISPSSSSSTPSPLPTRRPLVPVLGVRAVPTEVAPLAALVASHTGVEPPPAPPSGPRPGRSHPDPPPGNVEPVSLAESLQGVLFVSVDNESEAGHAASHPNLFERPELPENLLQVAFTRVCVEIGDVKAAFVVGCGRAAARRSSTAFAAAARTATAAASAARPTAVARMRPFAVAARRPAA